MSCEHVVCSLWDECNKILGEELKPLCAAEQPNNGMELTSALPTVDCPAYFQGKVCPLKPSLISHCDTSPCKVVIANWLPKSGVGA